MTTDTTAPTIRKPPTDPLPQNVENSPTSPAPTTDALPQGVELEDYIIDRVLGAGGFGITYRAKDKQLDHWVAIKEYFPLELSQRDQDGRTIKSNRQGLALPAESDETYFEWGLARFLQEAQVLAHIKHPHVMRVNRYFRAHGTAYIVMEYEQGETLANILADEETLSEDNIRGLLVDVIPALAAVHENGFLHRDLKPANLYVRERNGDVVLIDFGAARGDVKNNTRGMTALVSEGYSPPEQYPASEEMAGPWSDVYALGAMLFHCTTGHAPPEAVSRLLNNSLPEMLRALESRYSRALLTVIERAMALRPQDRYQSVTAMQEDLQRLSVLEETAAVATPAVDTPIPAPTAPVRAEAVATPARAPIPTQRISRMPSRVVLASSLIALVVAVSGSYWWSTTLDKELPLATSTAAQQATESVATPAQPAQSAVVSTQVAVERPGDTQSTPQALDSGLAVPELALMAEPFAYLFDQASAASATTIPLRASVDENSSRIEAWLVQAEQRFENLKFTLPEQDSALFIYQQILTLEPDNSAAQQGIKNIAIAYAAMAGRAIDKKKYSEAKIYVERGLGLDTDNKRLIALQKRLSPERNKKPSRSTTTQSRETTSRPYLQPATIVRTVPAAQEESLLDSIRRMIETDSSNTDTGGFSKK